jgi:NADH:ubiquinone reductase (non-electrogenic)
LINYQEDVAAIFRVADKDNSGTLTVEKIKHVLDDIYERYPQVKLYLKSNQMKGFHDLFKHSEGKETKELDIEEFKKALARVDSQVKMLPATAQVINM